MLTGEKRKPKDRTGQRFGKLTATRLLDERTKQGAAIWECLCDCGETRKVSSCSLPKARACKKCCRASRILAHTKRTPAPQIDDMLRRIYAEGRGRRVDRNGVPSLKAYARRIGWGESSLYLRARQLGLCKERAPYWSDSEIEVLEKNAANSLTSIQRALKRAGFTRSVNGIAIKVWQMNIRQNRPYYSAHSLAECLGFKNTEQVERWIKKDLLYARPQETNAASPVRVQWLIHEKDVRRFILKNPTLIDLRKVDQTWFFEIMFEGKAGMSISDALQENMPKAYKEDEEDDDEPLLDENEVIGHLVSKHADDWHAQSS